MEEVEVPSYFLCPISMEVMRDPVTISTGITYDRENIEKWLFSCKHTTCPVTKQELQITDLTPNHNLRRLIQSWCTLNSCHGIQRIPTPKPQVHKTHVVKILNEAKKCPEMQLKCLRRLRSIAHANESNKKCLESAGAVDFLASMIKKREVALVEDSEFTKASDEALNILFHLNPSDEELKRFTSQDEQFLDSLLHFLKCGNFQSRAYAIMLLKSAFNVADPAQLIGMKPEYFKAIVGILNDKISQQATKAALKILVELCPWGRNRIKATENGAVLALIELLLDTKERRGCELILSILDHLCSCAEGRAELLSHGAGIAIVSKKILRVSHVASDKAVRILCSISKFSATSKVLQEMLQVGVVSKLCLVLQVDTSPKTKEKTKEILSLHSRVWRDSICIPSHLLSSYPS
ncbi:E3 ubiquitin-protein ligase PUB23-like [Nicotiana tomentosiformis]|uniref:E3 ubiquitin-protein ligase PUB23-like n=1 Tax=Nicotiana tomentosiformis TaxID=4098 RepID=UPI00051C48FB|nr:E3 ubiquitin-protein ligase PUB23-like [Nicotiana tomentosiformis]